ncbi:ESF1 homolog isoform X2 [Haemaphysalis longicornis]
MKKKGGKIEDDRFKHIATDPRFRGVPRSQRKIKIDNRFAGMFDDKRFKLKYVMDKRGRPIHSTTSEDLKKYYAVASSDSESEGEDADTVEHPNEDNDTVEGSAKPTSKQLAKKAAAADDVSQSEDDDGGDSEETEDSEDESEEEDEEAEQLDGAVAWGELDRDAPQSDHVSRRLALCNMDWDKIRAQDLFVLLDSFKPPGGIVQRVSVYPSEFGKERIEHERVNGPAELVEAAAAESKKHSSSNKDEEGDAKKQREALRQYQLSRLRYYYAIAECDSIKTADHLYQELDGREYESSGTCLDLRFVPDDMTFTEEPTSVADGLPDPQTYKPLNFVTSALQSVNVQLTWDEDDPRRSEAMQRAFKEDGDHDDLKVYLASSSSEEEEEEEEQQNQGGGKEKGKKASMEAQIQKYRDLLKSLDGDKKAGGDEKDEDKDDVEMEVTWNPGLNKQVEDMVRRKQEQPEGKTPFQEFLEKRKEKRKLKRSLNKNGPQKADGDEESDEADSAGESQQPDQPFSDDELPSDVDLDDDFFKDRETPKPSKEGAKKGKKKNKVEDKTEDEETAKSKAELELLLMDEQNDGRHHFSLKKLLEENETGKGSRKRKRKAEREQKAAAKAEKRDGDDFQVDLADPRFSALYSSHHFNVDPTDPHFKKTKGMEAILTEKQRRRLEQPSQGNDAKTSKPRQSPASVPQPPPETEAPESSLPAKPSRQSLSSLASSVKLKVQQMKNRSKK